MPELMDSATLLNRGSLRLLLMRRIGSRACEAPSPQRHIVRAVGRGCGEVRGLWCLSCLAFLWGGVFWIQHQSSRSPLASWMSTNASIRRRERWIQQEHGHCTMDCANHRFRARGVNRKGGWVTPAFLGPIALGLFCVWRTALGVVELGSCACEVLEVGVLL